MFLSISSNLLCMWTDHYYRDGTPKREIKTMALSGDSLVPPHIHISFLI